LVQNARGHAIAPPGAGVVWVQWWGSAPLVPQPGESALDVRVLVGALTQGCVCLVELSLELRALQGDLVG